MASILKVDELQGITSAGDITVTSEGGAATQSLQQGLAKAWNFFDGTAGTIAYADSFNCSTFQDLGVGSYAYSLTNSMSNSNFSFVGTQVPAQGNFGLLSGTETSGTYARTTSYSGRFFGSNAASINSGADAYSISTTIHGDLA